MVTPGRLLKQAVIRPDLALCGSGLGEKSAAGEPFDSFATTDNNFRDASSGGADSGIRTILPFVESRLPEASSGITIKQGVTMAKKTDTVSEGEVMSAGGPAASGDDRTTGGFDQKVMGFAEDLGTLLGTAEKKATEWMSQRQSIEAQLIQIRDTASALLKKLAAGGTEVAKAVERGRERGRTRAKGSTTD